MRRLTVCEVGAPSFRVSHSLWWQLCCPRVDTICQARDTFWRLCLDFEDGPRVHWWQMAGEAETVLEW